MKGTSAGRAILRAQHRLKPLLWLPTHSQVAGSVSCCLSNLNPWRSPWRSPDTSISSACHLGVLRACKAYVHASCQAMRSSRLQGCGH